MQRYLESTMIFMSNTRLHECTWKRWMNDTSGHSFVNTHSLYRDIVISVIPSNLHVILEAQLFSYFLQYGQLCSCRRSTG